MESVLFDFLKSATMCHYGAARTGAGPTSGVNLDSLARVLLLAVDAECNRDHPGYVCRGIVAIISDCQLIQTKKIVMV